MSKSKSNQNIRIACMGGGNMGGALVGGLTSQKIPPTHISVYDPDKERLMVLHKTYGISIAASPEAAIKGANCVIFAVKPQHFEQAAKGIATFVHQDTLILSVAAGVLTGSILGWLGQSLPIVRAMPNLPALIGAGMSALWANQKTREMQKKQAESILSSVGKVVWLKDESLLDVVTAVSGSGPAYFFYLMEALEKAATSMGIDGKIAHRLVVQTALGAAKFAERSPLPLGEQRSQVTSKGGTTEAAFQVFDQNHFEQTIIDAVHCAKARATELSKAFA